MCDYSLHNVASRPARVGEKLITQRFLGGTCGFAAAEDLAMAVCLRPGTEVAFAKPVKYILGNAAIKTLREEVARFTQVNKGDPETHHDALEFACDGGVKIVLLNHLVQGQKATVLQLPAESKPKRLTKEVGSAPQREFV